MRGDPKSVMLFAAGFGTRMRPLTDTRPKPLVQVAGKPLLDHSLDLAREIEPKSIVVNAHYKSGQIVDHLRGQNIEVSIEADKILDTGGGLRAALPFLGSGSVFTMNTDAIWVGSNPLSFVQDFWNPAIMDALLLCIHPDDAFGHTGMGDFKIDQMGRASRGHGLIYSGVQIIKADLLTPIKERVFSLNLVWDRIIREDRLFATRYTGQWCDVGRPENIKTAETLLEYGHV